MNNNQEHHTETADSSPEAANELTQSQQAQPPVETRAVSPDGETEADVTEADITEAEASGNADSGSGAVQEDTDLPEYSQQDLKEDEEAEEYADPVTREIPVKEAVKLGDLWYEHDTVLEILKCEDVFFPDPETPSTIRRFGSDVIPMDSFEHEELCSKEQAYQQRNERRLAHYAERGAV